MRYPGKEAYHFPVGVSHTSPCMSPCWRNQPIRQGKITIDSEHDKIGSENEEYEDEDQAD